MAAKLITFLGRNTDGILNDAKREFGDIPALVIAREGDQLQPPAGIESKSVNSFTPDASEEYILIANGGTSAQLLPTIKKLLEAGAKFSAFDLQRDGKTQVW